MQPELLALFIPIITLSGGILIAYVAIVGRNRERMAQIERGTALQFEEPKKSKKSSLRTGMLMVGFALGLFVGHLLQSALQPDFDFPLYYFTMILFFGGLALIAHHLIEKKNEEAKDGE